jgi:tRNA pseudouridine38-40 synthase
VRTFRLVLEYDGTDFDGWQVQPKGRRTVQGCLLAALDRVGGRDLRVTGAGRTDAGVHAEGQVASVRADTRLGAYGLQRALNGVLPRDVAVLRARVAPDAFDARRDALSKRYRYDLWNGATRSPLRARRSLWVPRPLDLDAMRRAARVLIGTHDFACLQAAGSSVKSTLRALSRVDVAGEVGGAVRLEVEGSGFLRHMVRNAVGTLIEVGHGRRAPESIGALLATRDRSLAGPTAPARGLTLAVVRYPAESIEKPGS